MTTCPIPTGMDDLTPEWLTCALERTVTALDKQQIGTGQIADSVRLAITFDDGATTSLVAKVTSADESSRRAALMTRTYEKEVGFYADLAATLPVRTPRCYWTGFDESQAAYGVVLEDLAPAHQGDQMEGCSVDDAAKAVDELALLHGPLWNAKHLDGLSWITRGSGTSDPGTGSLVEMLLTGFLERYEPRLPPDVVELAQRAVPKLSKTAPPNGPRTLVHGDFRNDNLMFGGTDGRVCVLDWQTPAIGHAVSDLSYFLGGSLLVEHRRAHERALLERYRAGLAEHGVELAEDDCWRAYRRYAFAGLNMAVIASMLVGRTDRGDDMFMAMATRAAQHAIDLDSEALL
ncbi:MAG TPA: phosphotransferase [Acidimicrobiales bacterium]|nr:phosphotransferase [Acidimicrobiales bacterium]